MDSRRNRTHIQKLKITYHMKLNKPLTEVQPAPEEAFDLTATVGTQEAQSVSEQLKLPNPNNPDVTIQKSVAITELIKTWKL